jgi:hypothetical protein
MYCHYVNNETGCKGVCQGCSFNPYSNPNGLSYLYPQQFNYECPHCHGKFNYPSYKNGYTQVCPFCGLKMEGLS